jgi:hypothetical protein
MSYRFSIRLFLTAILGLWFYNSFAQKAPRVEITITATNAFRGTYLFISIYGYEDVTKIVYKVKDSLDNKELESDTQYTALQKYRKGVIDTEKSNDPALTLMKRFAEISERHTHYTKDSILFNTQANTSYIKLLNKVINTNTSALESVSSKNTRIILDGTHFVFIIKALNQNRRVFADSPTQKSYPILYALLHQTIELYRNKKNNTFLTTARTGGY